MTKIAYMVKRHYILSLFKKENEQIQLKTIGNTLRGLTLCRGFKINLHMILMPLQLNTDSVGQLQNIAISFQSFVVNETTS